jgi:hypothetical protein
MNFRRQLGDFKRLKKILKDFNRPQKISEDFIRLQSYEPSKTNNAEKTPDLTKPVHFN